MTDPNWHIAQFNIANARYPLTDSRMDGFTSNLEQINSLAEASPGFVWRLQSDSGNATDILIGDDPNLIPNMSVWDSVENLFDFAYRSAHRLIVAERRNWFQRPNGAYQVLWWIPAGSEPTVDQGLEKLALLDQKGPSQQAFTFNTKYQPPVFDSAPENMQPERYCSGWK